MSEQAEPVSLPDEVVTDLREAIVGRSQGDVSVVTLLWYGAVDIDPKHLVVWILLGGAPADELPAWFAPADGEWSADPQQVGVDGDLLAWMRALREEIRNEFSAHGWSAARTISVRFDSADRVQEKGWDYFR